MNGRFGEGLVNVQEMFVRAYGILGVCSIDVWLSREVWETWCGLEMLDRFVKLVISDTVIYPVNHWPCTSLLQIFTPLS